MTNKPLSAAAVTARALDRIQSGGEELLAGYRRRFGSVLNADNAAELFPDYAESLESRTKYRAAVHPAAQWVRDELFNRALGDPTVKEVVFTAGGNGAGKSIGSPSADLVMDTTLSNPEYSARLLKATLDAGKKAVVAYTFRPIAEAFEGVLERSQREGRTVSIGTLIKTHQGAAITVTQLFEQYKHNPNVQFRFVDNSAPEPSTATIALTRKQNYGEVREQLHAILESKRSEISESVYEATKGSGAR